ncbi:MAG: alpha/beta hydrolase [Vicinamibacterales bacterium]
MDEQYNTRLRIPNHPQVFARWARDSAFARVRSSRRLDVAYGPDDTERLDIFTSARDKAPVLVFIHGGWWRAFDKMDHSFIAPPFTSEGAMVVVPNYALCPTVTIDVIALQMVRALEWVWRHAALYGGDPERIVVAGHSAGGHLAAMLACCHWPSVAADLPPSLVTGTLAISGLFDLEPLRQAPFLRDDLRLTPVSARRLSPCLFPAPQIPLYATVGANESEEFQRQNELIASAWGDVAVPVCTTIGHADHLGVLDDLTDPHGLLHRLALRLLRLSA